MGGGFAITTTATSAKLPNARRGQFQFAVTNTSGRQLTVRGKVVAQTAEQTAWFTIEGQPERGIAPNMTLNFAVDVAIPATAPASPITFHLDALGLENPDEYNSQGPAIVLEVPPAPTADKKPFPWWIVAVAAAVVIVLGAGGGLAWYLLQPHPTNSWTADGTFADQVTHTDCVPFGAPKPSFVSGPNGKSDDKAFSFPPASYLDCGTTIGNFGTSNFRIKFSIKAAPSSAGRTYLMEKRSDCSAAADFWSLALETTAKGPQDKIMVEFNQASSADYVAFVGTRSVVDNQWHAVEVVREGTKFSLFVDGNLDSYKTSAKVIDVHPGARMLLGEGGPCTSFFSPGPVQLDDITFTKT